MKDSRRGIVAGMFLLFFAVSFAQVKCNCCTLEFRQFDFWIGEWEVRDSAGTLLGYNSIQPMEDSCALIEHWTGAKGYTGSSISFYDSKRSVWHQSWVDARGGSIIMEGGMVEGSMVMNTEVVDIKGDLVTNRTEWTQLEGGMVLHVWYQSRDGGATFKEVFRGIYTPR